MESAALIREGPEGHIPQLPTDIYNMILEKLYETIFLPGEIMPTVYFTRIGDDYLLEEHNYWPQAQFTERMMVLSNLDPMLYKRYQERYWSENTFVSTS